MLKMFNFQFYKVFDTLLGFVRVFFETDVIKNLSNKIFWKVKECEDFSFDKTYIFSLFNTLSKSSLPPQGRNHVIFWPFYIQQKLRESVKFFNPKSVNSSWHFKLKGPWEKN